MAVTTAGTGARTDLTVLTACCPPAQPAVADENAHALAGMFKALADPARVKIMAMLLSAEEVCACDVSEGIGKSAATASHHLKILREAGLVTGERRGTWVYYRAVPQRLQAVVDALAPGR
jgi:ArsR family transcriptional regulator